MKKLIVCALYPEAKIFIQKLHLKPITSISSFCLFGNEVYELVITGTGKVSSACGTTLILSRNSNATCIVNVGLCGSKHQTKEALFVIDQIFDNDNDRQFFPDTLNNHLIQRCALRTLAFVDKNYCFDELVDMEGCAFFEAASYFLTTEKIQLIKLVSDTPKNSQVSLEEIPQLFEKHFDSIKKFFDSFESNIQDGSFTEEETKMIELFFTKYHFTLTQKRLFKKLLWNMCVQKETSVSVVLSSFDGQKTSENKKNQRKKILEQLTQYLNA